MKKELLSRRDAELKDLEKSQPMYVSENTEDVAEWWAFDKEVSVGVNGGAI